MKVFFTGLLLIFASILYGLGADKESRADRLILGAGFLSGLVLILTGGLIWIWSE